MPSKKLLDFSEQNALMNAFYSDYGVGDVCKELGHSYKVVMRYWTEWFTERMLKDRCSRLNRLHKVGSKNPMHGKSGVLHPRYKEIGSCNGYRLVPCPVWWEGKETKPGKVYEHILVCCNSLGLKALPKGYVVHHKDGNILNNSVENLQMMTIGEHMRLHNTTHGKYCKEGATTIPNGSRSQE